jgi:hypothetical protein
LNGGKVVPKDAKDTHKRGETTSFVALAGKAEAQDFRQYRQVQRAPQTVLACLLKHLK